MTGFHDVNFPTDIAAGAVGGPKFDTHVLRRRSGAELRNARNREGYVTYDVSYGVRNADQRETLIAFFRARKGRAYGFRFRDKSDYQAVGQEIATGDGAQTVFQLIKTYDSGGETDVRVITKPIASGFALYVDSVLQASGHSLNTLTGEVTFDAAPAVDAVISADFTFDVPMRFDVDNLALKADVGERHIWQNIPLIEIKE